MTINGDVKDEIVVDFPEPVSANSVSLAELAAEIRVLTEQQTAILNILQEYKNDLGPLLEGMRNSPIGAMFGMRK